MGMKYWWIPCAVFLIKPVCSIGFKVNDIDIIRQWCRGRIKQDSQYIRASQDIILQMNKSKVRVKNLHMLTALLCGHYQMVASKNDFKFACRKCGIPFTHINILYKYDCDCCLVIPGRYPMSDTLSQDNVDFLKFVDRLQ